MKNNVYISICLTIFSYSFNVGISGPINRVAPKILRSGLTKSVLPKVLKQVKKFREMELFFKAISYKIIESKEGKIKAEKTLYEDAYKKEENPDLVFYTKHHEMITFQQLHPTGSYFAQFERNIELITEKIHPLKQDIIQEDGSVMQITTEVKKPVSHKVDHKKETCITPSLEEAKNSILSFVNDSYDSDEN